ncbi:MAG TPA: NCS2 family permease [Candidatus Limnocylindria bacterium]|nr:NCS2 family permease [Candidatus Limnocylindria bacterium]
MAANSATRAESSGLLERWFKLRENGTTVGTEVVGGITTFFVMAYIIALNPIILNFVGVQGLQDKNLGPGFAQTVAMTAFCAGVLTIAMGLYANRPFALAAGLGLNAVVAFQLILGKPPLPWPAAMGIILMEGIVITILVLTNLREMILNAIPLALKRSIGVGIGLFILLIGLVNAGIVVHGAGTIVTLSTLNTGPILTFVIGLMLTLVLFARDVKGALLLGIVGTTIIAGVLHAIIPSYVPSTAPGTAVLPSAWLQIPDFSNAGKGLNFDAFAILGPVATILAVFTIMLSDFFDTVGTVIGIGGQAGWVDTHGRMAGFRRILVIDSIGAAFGGLMSASSNTTYIESAAGVSAGARTGLASVVTGALFLLAMFLAPVVAVIPPEATAPALVIVGFLMAGIASKIDFTSVEEGLPALLTVVVMPFTYSITNGVGAGFVTYGFLKLARGKAADVHPLLWVVTVAFVLYFAQAVYAPAFNIGPYRE